MWFFCLGQMLISWVWSGLDTNIGSQGWICYAGLQAGAEGVQLVVEML